MDHRLLPEEDPGDDSTSKAAHSGFEPLGLEEPWTSYARGERDGGWRAALRSATMETLRAQAERMTLPGCLGCTLLLAGLLVLLACTMRQEGSVGDFMPELDSSAFCSREVKGLPHVYELNPHFGAAFMGAEELFEARKGCSAADEGSPGGGQGGPAGGGNRRLLQHMTDRDANRIATRGRPSGFHLNKNGTSAVTQIYGRVYPEGLYYIAVGVGNPPRTFFLDIDTGSHVTWLSCDAPCVHCAEGPHKPYSPDAAALVPCSTPTCNAAQRFSSIQGCSSNAEEEASGKGAQAEDSMQCDYDIQYADGSLSQGILVSDLLFFTHPSGSLKGARVSFGCAYDQEGDLARSPSLTDGILGLGPSSISLPAQLAKAGILANAFGHCLSPGYSGGGFFFLGNSLLPSSGLMWTPLLKHPELLYYFVPLIRILYDGVELPIDPSIFPFSPSGAGGGTVLDSGSSFSYLTSSAFHLFLQAVEKDAEKAELKRDLEETVVPHCWLPPNSQRKFNTVDDAAPLFSVASLVLKGYGMFASEVPLLLRPQGFLLVTDKGSVCLGVLELSAVAHSGGVSIIIGDISMRGLLLVYDNEKQRIGWSSSNCTTEP